MPLLYIQENSTHNYPVCNIFQRLWTKYQVLQTSQRTLSIYAAATWKYITVTLEIVAWSSCGEKNIQEQMNN